jgi:hypothetical protein
VVSEAPGIILGENSEGKVKIATVGRVKVKVDATKNPIRIGDLLVTSSINGTAMKSEPIGNWRKKIPSAWNLIGKSLGAFKLWNRRNYGAAISAITTASLKSN